MAAAVYYIDGVSFITYGVMVSKSDGLLSRPRLKTPQTVNWQDQHGEVADLSKRYYESRSIKLSCFIVGSNMTDFVEKCTFFLSLFDQAGTRRLMVDIGSSKPLVYEVYLDASADINKAWHDGQMVGTFSLSLKEPVPVKRVYSVTGTSVSMTITCTKAVDMFWGDGSSSLDVIGTGLVVNHSYGSSATRYIIVAGDLDAITSITTAATLVWSKL